MTEERFLTITGASGRGLLFAVERLHDGAFHHPGGVWRRAVDRSIYSPLRPEKAPGRYIARLPALEAGRKYCIYIVDVDTQQLGAVQLIDGGANMIASPGEGECEGRPAPRNQYYGGFVVDIRPGRQIELE
jgi:hypothetical protein